MSQWLPLPRLADNARAAFQDTLAPKTEPRIDRMDVRGNKGTLKVTFQGSYYEVQLDGATGTVLHIGRRNSDFLEQLHDGSILDLEMGWDATPFKLFYTSIMGLALFTFSITGFWLWYGPKRMRSGKR